MSTIQVIEKTDSRRTTEGENPEIERTYFILGTVSDIEAKLALLQNTPTVYDGLKRDSFTVEPAGYDVWEASVRYTKFKRLSRPGTGESTYSFDTSGGTQHITQSRETVGRYARPGQFAPPTYGAIGVTPDGVEGVDITVPIYSFSETHYLPDSMITAAYKATLFYLTGSVNSAPFRGFAAGEVLFLGASGSKRGEEDWEITFRFAASPNLTNIRVGEITGISKKGWEYLWVRYQDVVDEPFRVMVKRPQAVYVERVYPVANFGLLGIGA